MLVILRASKVTPRSMRVDVRNATLVATGKMLIPQVISEGHEIDMELHLG